MECRILAPLSSRCAKFRFKPLENPHVERFIRNVCLEEGLKCPDEVGVLRSPRSRGLHTDPVQSIRRIIELSGGDLRKAIMLLQNASWIGPGESLDPERVEELAGVRAGESALFGSCMF